MIQIFIDDDIRIELSLPLDPLWLGTRWTEDERREVMREKYPQECAAGRRERQGNA